MEYKSTFFFKYINCQLSKHILAYKISDRLLEWFLQNSMLRFLFHSSYAFQSIKIFIYINFLTYLQN